MCRQCLDTVEGGVSAVLCAMLERFVTQEFTDGVCLPGGFRFRQKDKAYFLGDLDAVRQIYSLKGSAGLRCCILCRNVLKANSGVVEFDPYFVEIGAADGFEANTDAEIWAVCDRLARVESKAEMHRLEKVSGLTFDSKSLMFNQRERVKLPPFHMINDYMHSYLCNGVASWEVALLMEKIEQHTSLNLEMLREAAISAKWKSRRCSPRCLPSYIPKMFHARLFGEGLYKGQAHQTASILPLLQYYVETVIEPNKQLPAEVILSFKRLCDCVYFIRTLNHSMERVSSKDTQHLDEIQRSHQISFTRAYDAVKPKHHVRFHLPAQYLQTGLFLSCECLESRHRQYKTGVAANQRSTVKDFAMFSGRVLARLLQVNFKLLKDKGLPFWELLPPIQEATLDDKIFLASSTLTVSERASATLIHLLGSFTAVSTLTLAPIFRSNFSAFVPKLNL